MQCIVVKKFDCLGTVVMDLDIATEPGKVGGGGVKGEQFGKQKRKKKETKVFLFYRAYLSSGAHTYKEQISTI